MPKIFSQYFSTEYQFKHSSRPPLYRTIVTLVVSIDAGQLTWKIRSSRWGSRLTESKKDVALNASLPRACVVGRWRGAGGTARSDWRPGECRAERTTRLRCCGTARRRPRGASNRARGKRREAERASLPAPIAPDSPRPRSNECAGARLDLFSRASSRRRRGLGLCPEVFPLSGDSFWHFSPRVIAGALIENVGELPRREQGVGLLSQDKGIVSRGDGLARRAAGNIKKAPAFPGRLREAAELGPV